MLSPGVCGFCVRGTHLKSTCSPQGSSDKQALLERRRNPQSKPVTDICEYEKHLILSSPAPEKQLCHCARDSPVFSQRLLTNGRDEYGALNGFRLTKTRHLCQSVLTAGWVVCANTNAARAQSYSDVMFSYDAVGGKESGEVGAKKHSKHRR